MTRPTYTVRVTKDSLVFCAGHFITFNGDQCERIHGHNYRVAVEVEDELDSNHYVFDFIALKQMTEELTGSLDHRMLLPATSPHIRVEADGPNWKASYQDRYWSFPQDECVVLPVANTTAELLAQWIAGRLRAEFAKKSLPDPRVLRVEVEECFGQLARYEDRRNDSDPS